MHVIHWNEKLQYLGQMTCGELGFVAVMTARTYVGEQLITTNNNNLLETSMKNTQSKSLQH